MKRRILVALTAALGALCLATAACGSSGNSGGPTEATGSSQWDGAVWDGDAWGP